MLQFFLKKLLIALFTLFLVSFVTVWLTSLSKISPLDVRKNKIFSQEVSQKESELSNLSDSPTTPKVSFGENYIQWVKRAIRADFGYSESYHKPVKELVIGKSQITFTYFIVSLVLILCISIFTGLMKAVFFSRRTNRVFDFVVLFFQVTPIYVLSLFLIILFAGHNFLNWFPLGGIHSDNYTEMGFFTKIFDLLYYGFLPLMTYSLYAIPETLFLMWSSSKQVLNYDFIRTSKAKGNTQLRTAVVHVLKNALIPVVSNLNAICLTLLTASLIVENAFHLNGLGSLLVKIVIERDFNTLIFVNILIAGFLLFIRFISELIISELDPRVDLGWGAR